MGREEIFIDLGGGAPKTPIFYAKMTQIRNFTAFAPCDAHAGWIWMACGPLTLSEAQGSWGHGPVQEYGFASDAGWAFGNRRASAPHFYTPHCVRRIVLLLGWSAVVRCCSAKRRTSPLRWLNH